MLTVDKHTNLFSLANLGQERYLKINITPKRKENKFYTDPIFEVDFRQKNHVHIMMGKRF
jgi:hypothetical protein